ncbi:hypothetical protein [Nocardia sp. NPDC050435]|uniref:hypothetical protein n=1 Tax=Nocardia sp. NPDC050435 TaxID=3155040 RepID=UPI0033CC4669
MNATAGDEQATADTKPKFKRMTLDTPPDLHGIFKKATVDAGTLMKDEVLMMLEARYRGGRWPEDVVQQVLAQVQRDADNAAAPAKSRGKGKG